MQPSPPCSGVGLVQLLVLFCLPPTHGVLQADVPVHAAQPPCIGTIIQKIMQVYGDC